MAENSDSAIIDGGDGGHEESPAPVASTGTTGQEGPADIATLVQQMEDIKTLLAALLEERKSSLPPTPTPGPILAPTPTPASTDCLNTDRQQAHREPNACTSYTSLSITNTQSQSPVLIPPFYSHSTPCPTSFSGPQPGDWSRVHAALIVSSLTRHVISPTSLLPTFAITPAAVQAALWASYSKCLYLHEGVQMDVVHNDRLITINALLGSEMSPTSSLPKPFRDDPDELCRVVADSKNWACKSQARAEKATHLRMSGFHYDANNDRWESENSTNMEQAVGAPSSGVTQPPPQNMPLLKRAGTASLFICTAHLIMQQHSSEAKNASYFERFLPLGVISTAMEALKLVHNHRDPAIVLASMANAHHFFSEHLSGWTLVGPSRGLFLGRSINRSRFGSTTTPSPSVGLGSGSGFGSMLLLPARMCVRVHFMGFIPPRHRQSLLNRPVAGFRARRDYGSLPMSEHSMFGPMIAELHIGIELVLPPAPASKFQASSGQSDNPVHVNRSAAIIYLSDIDTPGDPKSRHPSHDGASPALPFPHGPFGHIHAFLSFLETAYLTMEREWHAVMTEIDIAIGLRPLDALDATRRRQLMFDPTFDRTELYFAALQLLRLCGDWTREMWEDFMGKASGHQRSNNSYLANIRRLIDDDAFRLVPDYCVLDAGLLKEERVAAHDRLEEVRQRLDEIVLVLQARANRQADSIRSLRDGLFNGTSLREASRATTMSRYVIVFTIITILYLPPTFIATVFSLDIFPTDANEDKVHEWKISTIVVSIATYVISAILIGAIDWSRIVRMAQNILPRGLSARLFTGWNALLNWVSAIFANKREHDDIIEPLSGQETDTNVRARFLGHFKRRSGSQPGPERPSV